jgi:hypothetical protein
MRKLTVDRIIGIISQLVPVTAWDEQVDVRVEKDGLFTIECHNAHDTKLVQDALTRTGDLLQDVRVVNLGRK